MKKALRFLNVMIMSGAAAMAIAAAPVAVAESYAVAAGNSIGQFPQSPDGDGCVNGVCGNGGPQGGGGCTTDGTCGTGGPLGGGGCTAEGVCGHGGPLGGGGCVPGYGCFEWGQ